MSTIKKSAPGTTDKREFPRAAYDYHDDVTEKAVAKIREKAAPAVDKADLELVDGFGRYSA
ncbi:MAG: hypothetical protein ACYC0C_01115 [Devosia sp.]